MDAQLQMAVQMLKNMDGDGIKRLLDQQLELYNSKKSSSGRVTPKQNLKRPAPEPTPRLSPNSLKKSNSGKLPTIDLSKPKPNKNLSSPAMISPFRRTGLIW